ncbi:MAG: hypothetical protein ACYTDX_00050 [Planctomycetota bacterium]|jgi:hypothetical protein
MKYEHRQFGLVITLSLAAALAFCTAMTFATGEWIITGSISAIISLVIFLFHALTVRVDSRQVTVLYGFGPLRFRWAVKGIQAVRRVRNRWWYGWGIKFTPHGWLFNVHGLDAVEIEFDTGKRIRIGTDEPDRLLHALERASGQASH